MHYLLAAPPQCSDMRDQKRKHQKDLWFQIFHLTWCKWWIELKITMSNILTLSFYLLPKSYFEIKNLKSICIFILTVTPNWGKKICQKLELVSWISFWVSWIFKELWLAWCSDTNAPPYNLHTYLLKLIIATIIYWGTITVFLF